MAVHPDLRIVEMGSPDRTHGAVRIDPLVTLDPDGTRREWHIHAMTPGTAQRLRANVPITFYATNMRFMKTLHGVRVAGEAGYFESNFARLRMLAIGFFGSLLALALAPLLIFLPLLPFAILTFITAIDANLTRRRFRRDEGRAGTELPHP